MGIGDEPRVYRKGNSLIRADFSIRGDSEHAWADRGRQARNNPPAGPISWFNIGMPVYYGGPEIVDIDFMGLADPLLARLPIVARFPTLSKYPALNKDVWRIGHFIRVIPPGYNYAVKTGSTEKMDPDLAQYYEKLHFITSGDLLSWERIETIIAFNFGAYDHWRDAYVKQSLK